MKIYSDGKSRSLNGAFPRRFRLMNAGKEVPFIRTGRESIRISGELPIGELDIQELVLPKKEPEIKAEKLDVGNVAIVNKSDVERLDVMAQTLDKNANRIEEQMNALADHEATLANLETQNAESIELLSGQTASAVQMLKGAIDDAEKKNNAIQKALNKAISETSEDLSDSLVAHETANNPHRITKATIGLDKVENISPEDMPMTKEVKNAIDKKADKEAIKELKKKIDEAAKSQKNVEKGIERLNWVGGVGGNEIPSGGKKGQLLGKASNKTGDYTWVDAESGIEIKRVDVLHDTGDSGTLYLVPSSDPQTSNIYDEYIWADNGLGTYAWEKIGSTSVDLSGYVKSVNNETPDENGNVTVPNFTGTDGEEAGAAGLVPAPTTSDYSYALKGNGSWGQVDYSELTNTPTIPTSNDYWTVGTSGTLDSQTTYSKKLIYYKQNGAQDNGFRMIADSDQSSVGTVGAWTGRCLIGNEKRTFLLGTARNTATATQSICGIGAHTWASATAQTSAQWDNIYILPDGSTAVYIGGNGWRGSSGWFRVANNNSASAGYRVEINTGTSSSPTWRTVLPNQVSGTNSVLIRPNVSSTFSYTYATSINGAITADFGSSFGYNASAGNYAVALGYESIASGSYSIQLGRGTNSTANTMNVGLSSSLNVQLLDSYGKIPDARLNATIARTADVPTITIRRL